MANIPENQFGQTIAQPVGQVNVPRMDVSSGTMAALDTAGRMWSDFQETRNRANAALALVTADNQLRDAHLKISAGVLDGSIASDQAHVEFQKQVDAIKATSTQGLTQDHAAQVSTSMLGTAGDLQRSLQGVVVKRQQSETAATIDTTGDQIMKGGGDPQTQAGKYQQIVSMAGGAAGWTPEQQAAKVIAFRQSATHGYYDNQASTILADSLTSGNVQTMQKGVEDLRGVLTKVQGPEGEPMDPTQRAALTHTITGYMSHLDGKIGTLNRQNEIDAQARERIGFDYLSKATDLILKGQFLAPEFIKEATTAAAGTSYAPRLKSLVDSQGEVAGFAAYPADQRAALLEKMRREGATPGVGTTPEKAAMLQLLQHIDDGERAAVRDNPWQAAQTYGVIKDAPTLTPHDIPQSLEVMRSRMATIDKVEAWSGQKVSPLQPQEAEGLTKMIRALPIDQAASALDSLGAVLKDPERIAAFAAQIKDKDGAMALAMAYAGSHTTQGRIVAELVMRGDQALKDNTALVDRAKETGWQATIAKAVNGIYSNREVEQAAKDAAYKIAAAKYAESGSVDIDAAVNLATGGIATHGQAGARIPLPWGMDPSTFEKRIGAMTPATFMPQAPGGQVFVGKSPMPIDTFVKGLPDATLVHAGQGAYVVKAGPYFVTNADGQRIIVKVGQ